MLGELFARRLAMAHTRHDAVISAFDDVPDLYPILFGEERAGGAPSRAPDADMADMARVSRGPLGASPPTCGVGATPIN